MSFFKSGFARGTFFVLAVICLLAAIFVLPSQMRSRAAKGLFPRTESHAEDLPNYDIRTDKNSIEKLAVYRSNNKKTAVDIADARDSFVAGEKALRERIPTLKVEYNNDLKIPEIIATDVQQGKAALAGSASKLSQRLRDGDGSRIEMLKDFLDENRSLIGATSEQVSQLKVTADYTNPDGRLSFVEMDQEAGGIPVFRGEVKAGFNAKGEMFRVINNLAPGLDEANLSSEFGDPSEAVELGYSFINAKRDEKDTTIDKEVSSDIRTVFGSGDSATIAEKIYFPTEPSVAVPAWRIYIWQPVNAFYLIVDANNKTLLWRKNVTEDQTQSSTYSVYVNPNAMVNVADSPFPRTPGPLTPDGTQAPGIGRTSVSRIGNEAPYTFNNLGWITDGGTRTDGNNIQAGLDRDGTDGVDVNSEAVSATRDFTFAYSPLDPNTNTGDVPTTAAFQQGSVTHLFYISNWYHDITYTLGFNEAAGNYQNVNFTGQGVAGDRVRGEGQDSSGTNNANFSSFPDGTRGRMQMYLWTGPNPDIDGNLDADVVIHELTHGLSNRLHGNSSGLQLDIARGMGEGWSDFYAHCLLSEPTDPVNGVYTIGGYDTYSRFAGYTTNYYYGIRRFPKAIIASTGGPNNRPHNPLTFQDIDSTKINLTDGAFAAGPLGSATADQVHNIGEVWSSALWEVRARYINRLGWATGNRQILQLVTDGMKLAPLNPNPLSERDAIIAATLNSGTAADVADMWQGFAARGFGANASIQVYGGASTGGLNTVRVTESFDLPNLAQTPNIAIMEASGGNNNGVPDPGETVMITIPLSNTTGNNASNTSLQIVNGGSANYGTIAHAASGAQTVGYTLPFTTTCGSVVTLTFNVNSSLGPVTFTRKFAVGAPVNTFTENFDAVAPPTVPAGWSVTSAGAATQAWVSTAASSDTAPNSMFAADIANTGGSTELTSPSVAVTAAGALLTFRHRFNSEAGFDGGVLDISVNGGAFQDIVTAGGEFVQNGYNSILPSTTTNTLGERAAWSGTSGAYVTTVVRVPPSAVGQNVQFRWRFGFDSSVAPTGGGWNVDTISFAGNYACSAVPTAAGVTVSGRVLTSDGRGVTNARVSITDSTGNVVTFVTGRRGLYRFDEIEVGQSYVVSVASRRFNYEPRLIELSDNVTDLNFVPTP